MTACKKKGGDGSGTPGGEPAPEQPKEEPPVELKANWPVGKRLIVRTEALVEMEVQNPALPAPVKIDQLQSQEVSISVVKDREGGGREMEVEFLGYKVESRAGGRLTQVFDSKSDPKSDITNRASAPLRKLVGVKLKYLTDPAGKVDRVEGAAELLTKIVAGTPAAAQISLRAAFGEEGLKKMLPGVSGLPAQSVKVGETWPFNTTMPLPPFGTLLIEVTNTFKGMEDHAGRKCAAIEHAGGINITNRALPPGGVAPTLDEATVTGTTWFDTTLGTVVESTTEMVFTYKGAATTPVKIKQVTKLLQVADLAGGAAQVIPGSDSKLAAPKAATAAPGFAAEGVSKAPGVMKLDGAAPKRK